MENNLSNTISSSYVPPGHPNFVNPFLTDIKLSRLDFIQVNFTTQSLNKFEEIKNFLM